MDQRAEMAARPASTTSTPGPDCSRPSGSAHPDSTLSGSTDQDDLIYALSQKVADSGVDPMLQPLRGGS